MMGKYARDVRALKVNKKKFIVKETFLGVYLFASANWQTTSVRVVIFVSCFCLCARQKLIIFESRWT